MIGSDNTSVMKFNSPDQKLLHPIAAEEEEEEEEPRLFVLEKKISAPERKKPTSSPAKLLLPLRLETLFVLELLHSSCKLFSTDVAASKTSL
jgi:hypothetical protein